MDLTLDDDQRLLAESGPPAVRAHVPDREARKAEDRPERLLGRAVDPGGASWAGPASRSPRTCGGAGYGAAGARGAGRGARAGGGHPAPPVVVRGDAAAALGRARRCGAGAVARPAHRRRRGRRAGPAGARWPQRAGRTHAAGRGHRRRLDTVGHEDRGAVRSRRRRPGGERRPRRRPPVARGGRRRRPGHRPARATTPSHPSRSPRSRSPTSRSARRRGGGAGPRRDRDRARPRTRRWSTPRTRSASGGGALALAVDHATRTASSSGARSA